MNETNQPLLNLIEAHPLLFRGRPPALDSYLSPGWYALVDKLCSDITAALGVDACASFESRQIKEKYGTLRFYFRMDGHSDLHVDIMSPAGQAHAVRRARPTTKDLEAAEDSLRGLVGAASAASETICETCGAPAALRDLDGYLTTLCDRHAAEMHTKRAEHQKDMGTGYAPSNLDTVQAARSALRIFFNIAKAWRLADSAQAQLLGVDQATCSGWRQGEVDAALPVLTLQRLGCILAIYEHLQLLLPVPERADGWVHQPNRAPLFGGRPAIALMTGQLGDLQAVAEYLATAPNW